MRNIIRQKLDPKIIKTLCGRTTTLDGFELIVYAIYDKKTKELLATLEYNAYLNKMIYLRQLTVFEEYRKKGIGRQIISSFIKDMKSFIEYYDRIELEADNNSITFWLKCGFEMTNIMTSNRPRMVYYLRY